MYLACDRYGVDLVGGDTTSSQTGLVLSVTALGQVERGKAVRRSGASATDLLVVTGDLGAAYMGLQVLEREKAAWQANPQLQPELQGHEYVLERQLKPEPRVDMVQLLHDLGVRPTSMIDVSDGLSSEVLHLCDASGLGCKLFESKIPMDPTVIRLAEEFGINPITAALNGGEDYELLFTVPLEDWDKIKGNPSLTAIGHLMESPQRWLVLNSGQEVELKAQGFHVTFYTHPLGHEIVKHDPNIALLPETESTAKEGVPVLIIKKKPTPEPLVQAPKDEYADMSTDDFFAALEATVDATIAKTKPVTDYTKHYSKT
jgi:thiamine-monophosphate kinase